MARSLNAGVKIYRLAHFPRNTQRLEDEGDRSNRSVRLKRGDPGLANLDMLFLHVDACVDTLG
jgi:hypothetical protein